MIATVAPRPSLPARSASHIWHEIFGAPPGRCGSFITTLTVLNSREHAKTDCAHTPVRPSAISGSWIRCVTVLRLHGSVEIALTADVAVVVVGRLVEERAIKAVLEDRVD